MVRFEEIIGHERPLGLLCRCMAADRVAHAYLFHGPEGVGKRTVAAALAAALVCQARRREGSACGSCPGCLACSAGTHPDVRFLAPASEGGSLTLQQIRELRAWLGFTAARAPLKVAVVDRADCMTPEAANAFLKVLEEPPGPAVVVLVASDPGAVPATVRSRALHLRFGPVPRSRIEQALLARGFDPAEARLRAEAAGGAPGRALAGQGLDDPAGRLAGEWLRLALTAEPAAIDQQARQVEGLPVEAVDAALAALVELWRDAAVWSWTGREDLLACPARAEQTRAVGKRLAPAEAAPALADLLEARGLVQEYTSRRLVLDWTLMRLRRAASGALSGRAGTP